MQKCTLAMGCFWGPEENFKNKPGILHTEVGYAGGNSSQTTYEEVCTGNTGHAEVVKLTFDENIITFKKILDLFFKMHDPTQKDMQYPDVGTQYRSVIYTSNEDDLNEAIKSKEIYQSELIKNNFNEITTDIEIAKEYYLAEEYHQQYLAKNPNGYCGIGGTGCSFPNE